MIFIPNYCHIEIANDQLYLKLVFSQFFYDKIKKKYLETLFDG